MLYGYKLRDLGENLTLLLKIDLQKITPIQFLMNLHAIFDNSYYIFYQS